MSNEKLAALVALVKYGAGAGDVESYFKLLVKDKNKYGKIIIHICRNDSQFKDKVGHRSFLWAPAKADQ